MQLKELLSSVDPIPIDRGYWFIRTDSGINFDTFVQNDFIGIGWNKITTEDLSNKNLGQIKEKIAKTENFDLSLSKQKSQTTAIFTKLTRFASLKKGDLVLIPSFGSSRLAFGEIIDSKIYNDDKSIGDCDYVKRRKINWIDTRNINTLDAVFYQIKHPRHAIFDIKKYHSYLDSVTETLYSRNDYVHYILDINTTKDIDINLLLELMESIKTLTKAINEEFKLNEENEQLSIKLNLQSPGKLELIRKIGATIIIMATIFSSCTDGEAKTTGNKSLDNFIEVNHPIIRKIDATIKALDIDKKKINNL